MTSKHKTEILYRQRGIGLPAAIFVITLLAVIAVGINELLSQNAQSFEEELNLTRAFYAAESGAGFAMNSIYPPEEYPAYVSMNCAGEPPAPPVIYDFTVEGLNSCSAAVSCTSVTIGATDYMTIESEGSCGDVERTIQVRAVY